MKKIFAVLIVLSLMLGLAMPAMASQISATKDTIGEANTFYPGDTISYIMTVSNPATNSATNTLTRIWDTLPDGTAIEFLDSGETLVQEPGEFDTFYAEYVVDLDDAVWQDDPGRYRVTNKFQAVGIDSADDEIEASVNKNSTVLEFAELGDFVWNDMDRDGIQDEGEPGIADVTVNLWSADPDTCEPIEIIGTTTTDANGYYLFDELRAGNYRVQFGLPNGDWVFTLQNVGADDALDSDADPNTGISDCVALAAGDSNMTVDAGMYLLVESLEVSKTAITSYVRTHLWDIAKRVETEYGHVIGEEETPKIWLWLDGSGDETATWYVDVTYDGYEDSEHNVSGTVTITNTGDLDAVITDIDDMLGGTITITTDCGVTLPYTLPAGEMLICDYSEDGYVEGMNEVTVTTERDTYDADAPIVWGDPDEEIDAVVNIEDDSDLFGEVGLGTVTAPNGDTFTYDKAFAWTDYTAPGPYVYDNTAVIVETEQSADARLKVNWEPPEEVCWADETAWAYGGEYANPNWDYVNNMFWGWTNGPLSEGSYEWDVYAGAGQNDLSKGTVVGTVYVTYEDGCVTVRYEMDEGYYLGETHLWVGNDVLPEVTRGRSTVYTNSPGQFPYGGDYGFDPDDSGTWETEWTWSACDFEGDIYVAAHAVVWMEVECPEDSSM